MIYDENKHFDLVFNTIQRVGYGSGFSMEYERKRSEQVLRASGGKAIVSVNNLKAFGLSALGFVIALFIGAVLSFLLPCGRIFIIHMAAAYLCFNVGFLMIKSDKKQSGTYFKDQLSCTVRGVILILEGIALLVMWFNLPFETDAECSYFMAGTLLLTIALCIVISFIMHLTRGARIYTRSVDAECIGYVRKKTITSDADNHTQTRWYHSPVFKYFLDGREVIAFYDTLTRGINAKIPLGPCTIKVNKDDSGSVMNPSIQGIVSTIIIIAILVFMGYFFVAGVLSGGVSGTSISM